MLQRFGVGAGKDGNEAGRSPSLLPSGSPPACGEPPGVLAPEGCVTAADAQAIGSELLPLDRMKRCVKRGDRRSSALTIAPADALAVCMNRGHIQ